MKDFVDGSVSPTPIFFYCGNEGDLESFYKNTGQLSEDGGFAQ